MDDSQRIGGGTAFGLALVTVLPRHFEERRRRSCPQIFRMNTAYWLAQCLRVCRLFGHLPRLLDHENASGLGSRLGSLLERFVPLCYTAMIAARGCVPPPRVPSPCFHSPPLPCPPGDDRLCLGNAKKASFSPVSGVTFTKALRAGMCLACGAIESRSLLCGYARRQSSPRHPKTRLPARAT